ncbi:MAG: HNH endonuclease [Prevotella sp.]|nr:HNH endonuclease [Prevotella sp.]
MIAEDIIDLVWDKASKVEGYDPTSIRKDACGAWILRNQYGNRGSIYGWEVDHVYPQALGGGDDIDNLRAMQWENNESKGSDFPHYTAKVQADGANNVHQELQYTVNEELTELLRTRYNF